MGILMAFVLTGIAGILALLIWTQAVRHSVELLSARNFFLVGFILFQLVSGVLSLGFGIWGHRAKFGINNEVSTSVIYVLLVLVFLTVFLITYKGGWGVRAVARRVGTNEQFIGPWSTIGLALAFLFLGAILRVGAATIPVVGVLTQMVGAGMLALAAGLAAWVWGPRLTNPAVALPALFIILVALLAVFARTFGRRDIVGILLAVIWGFYFGYWRYLGFRAVVVRLTGIGAAGAVLLAAYTATRSIEREQEFRTPVQVVRQLASANVVYGLMDMASGQFAAGCSMWLIENRPRVRGYDTLHAARFLVTQPIPRVYYPDKPIGLGLSMVPEMKIRDVPPTFTVGPGIIGHIVNDNPWIALWLYPIFLALTFRFLDEMVRWHSASPFVVLPAGVALGQIMGLARGEAGLFAFQLFASVVPAIIIMAIARSLLRSMGAITQPADEQQPDAQREAGAGDAWEAA